MISNLAVFDVDGLIFDTKDLTYECYRDAFEQARIGELREDTFMEEMWGRPWKRAAENLGLSFGQAMNVHIIKNTAFVERVNECPVCMDVLYRMVAHQETGDLVVIATGGSETATFAKYHMIVELLKAAQVEWKRCPIYYGVDKGSKGFWDSMDDEYPHDAAVLFDDDVETCKRASSLEVTAYAWQPFTGPHYEPWEVKT